MLNIKSFNMTFQDQNGQMQYPYLTSWGVTTRLIGAVVMAHGDQKGLILPPKIAPVQVVIVPILKGDVQEILNYAQKVKAALCDLRVELDCDEHNTPGFKFNYWEQKGVPLRIEVGPKDLAAGTIVCVDRVDGVRSTLTLPVRRSSPQ